MGNRNQWNQNEPLSLDRGRKWRTDWESRDLPAVEKRLHRLYDLRQFAELCGAEIPNTWRRFLADEIDLGERRQAERVFEKGAPDLEPESTAVEEAAVLAGQYEATDEDISF